MRRVWAIVVVGALLLSVVALVLLRNSNHKERTAQIAEIEETVNQTLRKNLPVSMEFISQEEAMNRFDMKRLPENASDTVRVVHVGDYDECLCIGLHVENTSEIGTFKIISHDYKEGIFRMRFKLVPLP